MRRQTFLVPVDGEQHTFSIAGEISDVTAQAEGAVLHVEEPVGAARERCFQTVLTNDPTPAMGKFVETVLAPVEELRWWHVFEIGNAHG